MNLLKEEPTDTLFEKQVIKFWENQNKGNHDSRDSAERHHLVYHVASKTKQQLSLNKELAPVNSD